MIADGCPLPPPPPEPPLPEDHRYDWHTNTTWDGTQDHVLNPFNAVLFDEANYPPGPPTVVMKQAWIGGQVPGVGDNVWVPSWRIVVLNATAAGYRTPRLGGLIIEGTLLLGAAAEGAQADESRSVELSAEFVTIKGGKLLGCRWPALVRSCTAPLPRRHHATITLHGDHLHP